MLKLIRISMQNRLILFFFVTSLGSALSSVASFLSVENLFQSLIVLGVALSARTLASAIFSYVANSVIQRFGLYTSLIVSQLFGFAALAVLYWGFSSGYFMIVLLGVMLTGLPTAFVGILLTIILRVTSKGSDEFRKYSGKRELVFGMGMLLASVIAPLLLYRFSLNTVLLMDAISYILGLMLILRLNLDAHVPPEGEHVRLPLRRLLGKSQPVNAFLLKTSASLLLAGLLPLLASSGKIEFTADMPVIFRQWLWAIEDVTAISASLMYLIFSALRGQKWFNGLVMFSGAWLLVPIIFPGNIGIVIAAVIICLLTDFSGQKFRDDLVIGAGNDSQLIRAYSSLAQLQRNFIFFISPILLTVLLSTYSTIITFFVIVIIQLSLFAAYKVYIKDSVLDNSMR